MKRYTVYENSMVPSQWTYVVEAENEDDAVEQVKGGMVEPLNYETFYDPYLEVEYDYEVEPMEETKDVIFQKMNAQIISGDLDPIPMPDGETIKSAFQYAKESVTYPADELGDVYEDLLAEKMYEWFTQKKY